MQQFLTQLSTSPTEPVSLKDMLLWLRLEPGTDDAKVAGLITSARIWAEKFQNRSLVAEQFRVQLAHFPYFRLNDGGLLYDRGPEWEAFWGMPGGMLHADARRFAIELPRAPLVSLDSFTYLDTTGTRQTLASSAFQVLTSDVGEPLVYPADGTYWPLTAFDPAAVTITFTAGFQPTFEVVTAIKMMVAADYDDPSGQKPIPPRAKSYLHMDRLKEF